MGAYLSEPVTEKFSIDNSVSHLSYGASSMQGWRASQEDAHNCIPDFDKDTCLFSVYDGHGGAEVAQYCALKLPDFIKNTSAYKSGNLAQALEDAFLEFDDTLIKDEILAELKHMAGIADQHSEADENEVDHLYEEARMPLEELLAKYRSGTGNPNLRHLNNDKPISPYLRAKGSRLQQLGEGPSGLATSSSSSSQSRLADEPGEEASSACSSDDQNKENTAAPNQTVKDDVKTGKLFNGEFSDKESPEEEQPSTKGGSGDFHKKISSDDECCSNGEDLKEENKDAEEEEGADAPSGKGKGKGKKSSKTISSDGGSSATNSESKPSEPKASRKGKHRNARPVVMEDGSEGSEESDESDEEYEESQSEQEEENEEESKEEEEEADDEDEEEDEEEEEEEEEEEDEEESFHFSEKEEPGFDSGCTAVVTLLRNNELYVANAGDSRCVVCRNGKAIEMSHDHKPEDDIEMRRIVNAGGKVTSDGRVNGGLNLSRAIGDHSYKKNKNVPKKDQMISALPDIRTLTIDPNEDEFMVIACDGIWNFMSSQDVVDFIREKLLEDRDKLSSICEELFDHCLAPTTVGDGTGCDNMTAIIVKFHKNSVEAKADGQKRGSSEMDTTDSSDTKKLRIDDSKD